MNAQIKKLTQAFPAFRLRLADNKRWALMAGVGLAVAATAIIVSVLWTGNRGYVSLYGRQENLPVSQIVTVLDGESSATALTRRASKFWCRKTRCRKRA